MAEKETKMVMKVDLQCCRCYKKVKKVLAKFPQIRAQTYDEKANTVTINVVCCSPEKIRDKLYCKGGVSIKCIEIITTPPKPPATPPKPPQNPPQKPPATPSKPPETVSTPSVACPQLGFCCTDCSHGRGGGPCHSGRPPPPPCHGTCCRPVCDSWGCGGGYKHCYESQYCYVSRRVCFSEENRQDCSSRRDCCSEENRQDCSSRRDCFCEENRQDCSIM